MLCFLLECVFVALHNAHDDSVLLSPVECDHSSLCHLGSASCPSQTAPISTPNIRCLPGVATCVMSRDVHHAYRNLGYIGEGAYGVVVKAETITPPGSHHAQQQPGSTASGSESTSQPGTSGLTVPRYVAIKQMNLSRSGVGVASDAYREMKLLLSLHHPNIISLLHTCVVASRREVDLVYDYAEHDLADIIRHHRTSGRPMDIRCVKSVVHQLLQGLGFLHSQWVVHRDVKPANLLVLGSGSGEAGRVKVADFGLARSVQSPIRSLDRDGEVVTIWYRAPELLLGAKHYTRAIDVWAVGCIMYELLALQPAFPGDEVKGTAGKWQEPQMRKVMAVLGTLTADSWPDVLHCEHWPKLQAVNSATHYPSKLHSRLPHVDRHSRCFHLLSQLLCYDPNKRITCDEALEHGWFKELPLPSSNCFKTSTHEVAQYPPRQVKPLKRGRESGAAGSEAAGEVGEGSGSGTSGPAAVSVAGAGGVCGVGGVVVQVGGTGGSTKVSGSVDSGRVASVTSSNVFPATAASEGPGSTSSKRQKL